MDAPTRAALDDHESARVVVVLDDHKTAAAMGDNSVKDGVTSAFIREPEAAKLAGVSTVEPIFLPNLGVAVGFIDENAGEALDAMDGVEMHAAMDMTLIRPMTSRSARAQEEATWGIQKLGIPDLWSEGLKGNDVVVGHLDTGVDNSHPQLDGKLAAFAEFDYDGNHVAGAIAHDTGDHGTHTAATIAGGDVNKPTIGVAPGATLASGLVIEGGDTLARVLRGLEWLVDSTDARILSLSLGFKGFLGFLQPIIQRIRNRQILPVIAIGNEGPGTSRSPGNYETTLAVGATQRNDVIWPSSSSKVFQRTDRPIQPDVVAPGAAVVSAVRGGKYKSMSGTSMATPHIAGLAALLLEAHPNATVDQLEQSITASGSQVGSDPKRCGYGIVNARIALDELDKIV